MVGTGAGDVVVSTGAGDVVVGTAVGDMVVGTAAGDIVVVWCSECKEGMGSEIQPRGNAVVVVAA